MLCFSVVYKIQSYCGRCIPFAMGLKCVRCVEYRRLGRCSRREWREFLVLDAIAGSLFQDGDQSIRRRGNKKQETPKPRMPYFESFGL
jgi:hypothetical protein